MDADQRRCFYFPPSLSAFICVHRWFFPNKHRQLSLLAACLLVCASPCYAANDLAKQIQPLIDAHNRQVGVAISHLPSSETFLHRADEPMPTASLIKFPLMIATHQAIEAGKLDLMQKITLRDEDKVPGSGILTPHFSPGATLSLNDAMHLMIVYSDNTATNLVIDQVCLPACHGPSDGGPGLLGHKIALESFPTRHFDLS